MGNLARIIPSRQLQPIDLVAPGFRGLNLIQAAGVLPPAFATEALNAVLDAEGRLQARAGFTPITTTVIPAAPTIRTLHQWVRESGSTATIVAWNGGLSTSLVNPSGNDISGAVTDANGTWQFVNFNDKVIGFQPSLKPIVYNGSGNFATVVETDGTAPDGGVGLAAYGRVWGVDGDLQTIQYSGLLDETKWSTGGAGSINMRHIWTTGTDIVMALAAFNGFVVVFGRRHIVLLGSDTVSPLGLDVTTLKVIDVIGGVGTISKFSIQHVGKTDIVFASSEGVQSLARIVIQKSAPVANLSKYVRDDLVLHLSAENAANLRSTYNPLLGSYVLALPAVNTTWVFNLVRRWTDDVGDELAVVTRWDVAPTALATRLDNSMIASIGFGKVHQYSGNTDDGSSFRFIYKSPWLDLGEEVANRLKILKRLGAIVSVSRDVGLVFKWSVDFKPDVQTLTSNVIGTSGVLAEWGIAEYGLAEFGGGGSVLRILKVPARNATGQYYRLGLEADVTGELSIQQAELFAKIGRLA